MINFTACLRLFAAIADIYSAIISNLVLLIRLLYASFVGTVDGFRSKKRASGCSRRCIRSIQEYWILLSKSTLESRAGPNQRLVTAFGIDNAFTTTDLAYHKKFVKKVKELLYTSDEQWMNLATFASDFIEDTTSSMANNKHLAPLSLTKLVQSLVFQVVILKFFPSAEYWPSDEDVKYITTAINSQWLMSKSQGCQDPVELSRDREELTRRLQPFVDVQKKEDGNTGRESPLNIILPAYETLWRVVMRCFLEVRFVADAADLDSYAEMFKSFLEEPNQKTFKTPHDDGGISIKHIVDEALRLYPPTRRIYRQVNEGIVAVDIEYVHRESGTWGTDSLDFAPSRWIRKKPARLAFIPFGAGRFECPARSSVGPMMIGILVGGLLSRIGNDFELVRDGLEGDALGPGPLEGGREAYADLQLKRL